MKNDNNRIKFIDNDNWEASLPSYSDEYDGKCRNCGTFPAIGKKIQLCEVCLKNIVHNELGSLY